MTPTTPLVDLSPAGVLLMGAGLAAAVMLAVLAWQRRHDGPEAVLAALTRLTLFLTFDLIVFGAFTRLSDSGLGCPDWPGCYGEASPWGATHDIARAEAAMPHGPVTWSKAWIEMIHRYLAMTVGALILAMAVAGWMRRRALPHSPWWPTATLAWVVMQGVFGKYTVTLKLYPAIVTLHLLGGLGLLALLVLQHQRWRPRAMPVSAVTRAWAWATTMALWVQIALGGWVSTNYAVLACRGFPSCNGDWWPAARWAEGFELLRPLGQRGSGEWLSFEALVAIHLTHRIAALVLVTMLAILAWRLWNERAAAEGRRWAWVILALMAWQVASGLSNVVLGWPIVAALAHSAGAALLVGATTGLLAGLTPVPSTGRTANGAQAQPRQVAA